MIWRINRKLSKGEDTLGRQLMLKVRFKPASIKPTEHDRLRILSQFERVRMLCVLSTVSSFIDRNKMLLFELGELGRGSA